VNIKIS